MRSAKDRAQPAVLVRAQRSSMRVVAPRHQSIPVRWLEAAGKLLTDPSARHVRADALQRVNPAATVHAPSSTTTPSEPNSNWGSNSYAADLGSRRIGVKYGKTSWKVRCYIITFEKGKTRSCLTLFGKSEGSARVVKLKESLIAILKESRRHGVISVSLNNITRRHL